MNIKSILINGRRIPIPIPLGSLRELVSWVEGSLLNPSQLITRVSIDQKLIEDFSENVDLSVFPISANSEIHFQIESPRDLLIQSFEAIHHYCKLIQTGLKPLAVDLWQLPNGSSQKESVIATLSADLKVVLDILDQAQGIVDWQHIDLAALHGQYLLLKGHRQALLLAIDQNDWKKISRILIHRIDTLIKDMLVEIESLHIRAMSIDKDTPIIDVQEHSLIVGR
ncbi:MAG: hypothetical protein KBD78_00530 [Oligoflexales bacterium]|nr:hypothetical protein [Oligoflexales bacterium]